MDAMKRLERLAARARLEEAPLPEGAASRLAERVWRKVESARQASQVPDATPWTCIMAGAALAAAAMLVWSLPALSVLARSAGAGPLMPDFFVL